jgi:hypothetical protein
MDSKQARKEIDKLINRWNSEDPAVKTYNQFFELEAPFKNIINREFLATYDNKFPVINLYTCKQHNDYYNEFIDGLLSCPDDTILEVFLQPPPEFFNEDKNLYIINNNQFFSTLLKTTDLDSYITYYKEALSPGGFYDTHFRSMKPMYEKYLAMLEIKKLNPYIKFINHDK